MHVVIAALAAFYDQFLEGFRARVNTIHLSLRISTPISHAKNFMNLRIQRMYGHVNKDQNFHQPN